MQLYLSGRKVDNQVRNPNEPCRFPHYFFQNSSLFSPPKTGPSSQLGDTPNGAPNASDTLPLLSHLLRKKSLKKKTPLAQQVLHLLRVLLSLLLRKSKGLCLLSLIG